MGGAWGMTLRGSWACYECDQTPLRSGAFILRAKGATEEFYVQVM